jgi:CheY-like chemotaxis protein
LLADDDADDRALFESAYHGREDIQLFPCVVNGVEIINHLKSIPEDGDLPDLIILDQNMPLMNGKETLKVLKASNRFSKIPVCICSTYADFQLIEDCAKLGAHKVSSKPITEAEYHSLMDNFLSGVQLQNSTR